MSESRMPAVLMRRRRGPKVFGVGTLKTGTTSLGAALEVLGYRHTHARRNHLLACVAAGRMPKVWRWVDRHDSFEDWPWPLIYREIDDRYPQAKFVLTTRKDPRRWLDSIMKHARSTGPTLGREMFFGEAMPQDDAEAYLRRYHEHNDQVREHFADRPDKLLEVCWEDGDGWSELCRFLECEVPHQDFPVLNTAENRLRK